METLSEIVLRLMADRGWQQIDLAHISGVSASTIHKIVKGKTKAPDRETVTKLAIAFGVPPDEIYRESEVSAYSEGLTAQEKTLMRLVPTGLLPMFLEFTREWVMQPDDDRAIVADFQRVLRLHREGPKAKKFKAAPRNFEVRRIGTLQDEREAYNVEREGE